MADDAESDAPGVLRSKRDATRYQILAEIAERQPAVNQREIADAIGVTAQAVSDYLQGLIEEGHVAKHGRGRYEVTKEGVDWLITRTDDLREFVDHVATDVIEQVEVEAAIATDDVAEGETVSLSMREGVLHASPGDGDATTAVAVTDAEAGREVGVAEVEGVLDYELGSVTVVSVPRVHHGGSGAVDPGWLAARADEHDLLAVAGTEALAAARAAGLDPDLQVGTDRAVPEAAMRGRDVLLVAVVGERARHTDALGDANVSYEVVETGEREE